MCIEALHHLKYSMKPSKQNCSAFVSKSVCPTFSVFTINIMFSCLCVLNSFIRLISTISCLFVDFEATGVFIEKIIDMFKHRLRMRLDLTLKECVNRFQAPMVFSQRESHTLV